MVWLTFIWKALSAIKPRTWLLLAFLAAVIAAQLHFRHRWLAEGRAEVQAKWDASIARGREEIARLDRENAAAEAQAKAAAIFIGESRARDLQDQLATRDRTISDLRTGNIRLRQQWRGCVSQAEGGSPSDAIGGANAGDDLRATGAADLVRIGQDADSKVKRLQEFVQVQQEFMRSVCQAGP